MPSDAILITASSPSMTLGSGDIPPAPRTQTPASCPCPQVRTVVLPLRRSSCIFFFPSFFFNLAGERVKKRVLMPVPFLPRPQLLRAQKQRARPPRFAHYLSPSRRYRRPSPV